MNPLITVVVPTCLRPALLRDCLLALAQQKLTLSQFEVIVVDQVDDWATAAVVSEVSRQTGLVTRYFSQPAEIGLAAAYNQGWKAAHSLFIAFTHEDCVPRPLWLTSALPLFRQGTEVIIGRVQYPIPRQPVAGPVNKNMFCRRSLLEQVGGFDEALDRDKYENADWLGKLTQIGVSVTSCSDAIVVSPLRINSLYTTIRSTLHRMFLS